MICIALSIILIVLYIYYWQYNTFLEFREAKLLLQSMQNKCNDRLLSPSIISNFNYLPRGKFMRQPILLCPDIGGSKLYNKNKQIWPTTSHLSPFMQHSESWRKLFELNVKERNYIDKKNILIKTGDTLDSINILYKYGDAICYSFHPLIHSLLRHKYKENINLYGAPYEFRKISNFKILLRYFSTLKKKIEFSFKKNKKSIVLVGHTLGGIILNIFLTYYVTQKWKKLYIRKFIAIHVPFLGCEIADMALVKGTNEGLGIRSLAYNTNQWYHSIEKNMSGIHLLSTQSTNKFIQKLLLYRCQDPNVSMHIIQGTSPLIKSRELRIPDNWRTEPHIHPPIQSTHKNIINNLKFLKLFKHIIKDEI